VFQICAVKFTRGINVQNLQSIMFLFNFCIVYEHLNKHHHFLLFEYHVNSLDHYVGGYLC